MFFCVFLCAWCGYPRTVLSTWARLDDLVGLILSSRPWWNLHI